MSEDKKEQAKLERQKKAAVLRKAIGFSVGVFFFGVGLFVAIVILIARFASKTGQ